MSEFLEPLIGEVRPDYPRGYGFCQCGCGKQTKRLSNGKYPKFLNQDNYSAGLTQPDETPSAPGKHIGHPSGIGNKYGVSDELSERYLDLAEKARLLDNELQRLKHEIEFAISFIERNWGGDTLSKKIITDRLENALRKVQNSS